MRCGSRPGNASTAQQGVRQRKRLQVAAGELEDAAVLRRQPAAHRGRLSAVTALAEDRPGGGLVRRVEEHRPQPSMLRLQPADHRVPLTDRFPVAARAIQGKHSGHLGLDTSRVSVPEQASSDDRAVLCEDGGCVMLQVVGNERQRHRVAVGPRPTGVRTEPEVRRGREREGAVGRDGDDVRRRIGHRCLASGGDGRSR